MAHVKAALLCASLSRTITRTTLDRLQVFINKSLRRTVNIQIIPKQQLEKTLVMYYVHVMYAALR